jgi:hypothetical protein
MQLPLLLSTPKPPVNNILLLSSGNLEEIPGLNGHSPATGILSIPMGQRRKCRMCHGPLVSSNYQVHICPACEDECKVGRASPINPSIMGGGIAW